MKLLLIGCGYWGTKLAERFLPLVGGKNLGFYDVEPVRAKEVMERLGDVDTAQLSLHSLDAAIESYGDAVVIATPPDTHYEITKRCLEAGKHVLVEKPMALERKEAFDLVDIAQQQNVALMTDSTFLYHPVVKEIIADGATMRHMEMQWVNPRKATPPEGIWWTVGPHPVALMLALMGHRYPTRLETSLELRRATATCRMASGDTCRILLDWDVPFRRRSLWVDNGERGQLFDLDVVFKPNVDPLTEVCKTFIEKCSSPSVDVMGAEVVSLLQAIEEIHRHASSAN